MARKYDGPRDPFNCLHYTGKHWKHHLLCNLDGKEVWVDCQTPHMCDLPRCRRVPPDNSEEAKEKRVKWMREHGII